MLCAINCTSVIGHGGTDLRSAASQCAYGFLQFGNPCLQIGFAPASFSGWSLCRLNERQATYIFLSLQTVCQPKKYFRCRGPAVGSRDPVEAVAKVRSFRKA